MNGYLNGKPVSNLSNSNDEINPFRTIPPVPPPHAGPPKRKPVRRMPVSIDSSSSAQRNSHYEGLAPTGSTGSTSSNSVYPQRPLSSGSKEALSGSSGLIQGQVNTPVIGVPPDLTQPSPIPYLESDNISARSSSSSLPERTQSPIKGYNHSQSPSPSFYTSQEDLHSNERLSYVSSNSRPGSMNMSNLSGTSMNSQQFQGQLQSQPQPHPHPQSQQQYQQYQSTPSPQIQPQSQLPPQQYQQHPQPQSQSQSQSQYYHTPPPQVQAQPQALFHAAAQAQAIVQGNIQPQAYKYSHQEYYHELPTTNSPPPQSNRQYPNVPPILVPTTTTTYDSDQNVSPTSRSSQQQFTHRRSGSTHSASSGASFSQPLYMSAPSANTGVRPPISPISFPNPYASQTSFQHSRGNSVSSRISNNGTTSTSMATRSATTASSGSYGSNVLASAPSKPEVPGMGVVSVYVRQLRRGSSVSWSDVSPKVWGLPVGISTKPGSSLVKPTATYAKSLLRRTIDPRHSHLTPRLLASEIDEDDDLPMNPSQAAAHGAASAAATSASNTSFASSDAVTPTVSDGMYKFNSSLSIPQEETGSIKSAEYVGGTISRTSSTSSTKSVEEDIGKIRLFVANPDDI